jgi:hypothetical protein
VADSRREPRPLRVLRFSAIGHQYRASGMRDTSRYV